ncbi:MAG TPA: DUF6370 family protein [Flavisolibacter sp.]|nr:DUF6370 family protein [Flavisolibacter sp.]
MRLIFVLVILFSAPAAFSQIADSTQTRTVEAACGQCQFGLKGKGCNLAVRVKDKAYFVDGTGIDDHGDAHAQDGFCNAVRKAAVKGKLVKGRFRASYFRLIAPAASGS